MKVRLASDFFYGKVIAAITAVMAFAASMAVTAMHIRYSVFNDSSNGGDGFGNLFGMNAMNAMRTMNVMKTMNVINTMKVNEPHEFGINVTETVSSV